MMFPNISSKLMLKCLKFDRLSALSGSLGFFQLLQMLLLRHL